MNESPPIAEETKGLPESEAAERLRAYGPNALPAAAAPSAIKVFFRQFLSPLIYILLAATLVSVAMGDIRDAAFIGAVLLINGVIGTIQEYSANRAAMALRSMEQPLANVIRGGYRRTIDAREIVPGDLVVLDAGSRVPADIRLLRNDGLRCDEAMLTGESEPVAKEPAEGGDDSGNYAYAGTLVTRGRAIGVVTATGSATRLGEIAGLITARSISRPPLLIRMDRFARTIAVAVGMAALILFVVGLLRELAIYDLFLMAVALSVAAIPEGLPVSISIALAIGMRRMARVNVIVRNMPAIEALGSCTMIATDKTGTLTMNELTVTDVLLPDGTSIVFEPGHDLESCTVHSPDAEDESEARSRSINLLKAGALPNEATLVREGNVWAGIGDTVDVALLAAARKAGLAHDEVVSDYPVISRIPYEPDLKYAASFHRRGDELRIFVKGAPETLIGMADRMEVAEGIVEIDRDRLLAQKNDLASRGLRVLAFAKGTIASSDGDLGDHHLVNLIFLGLAGMQDPVRARVPKAIQDCREAGITVTMITGDDPATATAIATEAGLQFTADQIVTGSAVRQAEAKGESDLDDLTRNARIYSRVEPTQKLAIVLSMARNGHFVAVTGDGVNDAPALKHAHVGVVMGRKGTDVAKESADIIITDDNFASIVAGIREGRVSYANIRKVIFMMVSTGAAEVVLFLLAIPLGLPLPLLPVQLLWLNLVTNSIQDVGLAAERAEGDELSYPPRDPKEPIFDRVMLRRIVHSTLVMGVGGFITFWWLLRQGYGEFEARNLLLLLFVLFENVQTFNSRSEHHSVFVRRFFSNPFLVLGVIGSQALHIASMYIPTMSATLAIEPVSMREWAIMLAIASILLVVMEFEKWWDKRSSGSQDRSGTLPTRTDKER